MIEVPCRIAERILSDDKAYKVRVTFTKLSGSSSSSETSEDDEPLVGGNDDTDEPLVGNDDNNGDEPIFNDDITVDDEPIEDDGEIIVDDNQIIEDIDPDDDDENNNGERQPVDPNANEFSITEVDIWQGGFKIEQAVSSGTGIELGSCIINKMTLTISNIYEYFNGVNFKNYEAFVEIGYDSEYGIPKGYYTVNDVKINGALISLTCYDYMSKFDAIYNDGNPNYPITPTDIIDRCCMIVGIDCVYTKLINGSLVSDEPQIYKNYADENTTCRQMLSWALEAMGCYGQMSNSEKKLLVRSIVDKKSIADYDTAKTSHTSVFSGTSNITSEEAERLPANLRMYYNHQARIVDRYGLSGFDSLFRLSLPNVRKVYDFGIAYDKNLQYLYLPKAKIIESGAFCYDSQLTDVRLDSIEELKYYAFTGCNALRRVYIYSNEVCVAGEEVFYNCPNFASGGSGKIYVPANLVNAYKVAEGWSQYADLIFEGQNQESEVNDPVNHHHGLPDYDTMYEKSNSQNADAYAIYSSRIDTRPRKITQVRIIASGYGLILDEPEPTYGFTYISKEKFEANAETYAEETMEDEYAEQGGRKYYFSDVVERALANGYQYKEIPVIAGEPNELNGLVIDITSNPFFTFDAVESGVADDILEFLTENERWFCYGEITHSSNPTLEAGDLINVYTANGVYKMYASKTVFSTSSSQETSSIIYNDDGSGDMIPSSHNSYYTKSEVNEIVNNTSGDKKWIGSQSAFEAIPYMDNSIIYYVYEDEEMESNGN